MPTWVQKIVWGGGIAVVIGFFVVMGIFGTINSNRSEKEWIENFSATCDKLGGVSQQVGDDRDMHFVCIKNKTIAYQDSRR